MIIWILIRKMRRYEVHVDGCNRSMTAPIHSCASQALSVSPCLRGAMVLIVCALLGVGTARACGLDGVPSLSIDGRLVAVNKTLTSAGKIDTWTPFVARGVYAAGRSLLFTENRANVALSLPPLAFRYPWRWTFGDGASARGMSAQHIYRRPGTYIVAVQAYLVAGAHHQWYPFDKATIHVR